MLKKVLSIEGNIGSGKSTLIKLIQNQFKDKVLIIQEPVVNWQAINNDPNLNLLDQFYKDPKRWGYTFQMYAFYSRLKQYQDMSQLIQQNKDKVIITERSIYSDKYIFATNGLKLGFFNDLEWALYNDSFDFLTKQIGIQQQFTGFIYLRTSPEKSFERIQKRSREEEKSQIELDYINQIHQRHEEWLNKDKYKDNLTIIDGQHEFEGDSYIQQQVLLQVEKQINN